MLREQSRTKNVAYNGEPLLAASLVSEILVLSRAGKGNTVGSLTSTQRAVLVGSMLGDGTLRKQGTRTNALFEVNHAAKHRTYVDWKWSHFREYVLTPPKPRQSNGGRIAYRFTTRSLPVFTDYYQWFYRNGRKRLPHDLELDPLMLAVWFMDDGAKSRSACYLNTQQFSLEEQNFLRALLRRDLGLRSTLNRDKHYWRLRVTSASTIRMRTLLEPHVLSMFKYKS